jgi:hypothetical protein
MLITLLKNLFSKKELNSIDNYLSEDLNANILFSLPWSLYIVNPLCARKQQERFLCSCHAGNVLLSRLIIVL